MSEPRTDRREVWRIGLSGAIALGSVTALAGLATIVVAHAVVQPALSDGLAGARRALGDVEGALGELERHEEAVAQVFDGGAALLVGLRGTLGHAPDMMEEAADTTKASADILRATAQDLRTLAASVDLFVNEEGLVKTSRQMDQAAAQMAEMVKETQALTGSLRRVRAGWRDLSEPVEELLARASEGWRGGLSGASGALREAGETIDSTALPLLVALCIDGFGLLLLALGGVLVIVATNARTLLAAQAGAGAPAAPNRQAAGPRRRALVPAEDAT